MTTSAVTFPRNRDLGYAALFGLVLAVLLFPLGLAWLVVVTVWAWVQRSRFSRVALVGMTALVAVLLLLGSEFAVGYSARR